MKSIFLALSLFLSINLFAQQKQRTLCILDISERNNETNDSRLFSLEHMANVAGIPTVIIDDLEEALEYGVVISTSTFADGIFNTAEKGLITDYVNEGGVIIAPRLSDPDFFSLFGISEGIASKTRYLMNWRTDQDDELFRWVNEPEEKEISLGRSTQGEIYKTVDYVLNGGKSLATYEDGGNGFVVNNYGDGTSYAIGFSWKEVILRNQINRDYEAQRVSGNGFEPTQDVFMFLLRSIFNKHIPYSTWKYTAPRNASSTMQITHDLDSRTAMDSLFVFANSEKARGISATYNVTVRYFSDEAMSDFYIGNKEVLPYVLERGHVLGSHSVGHFRDFADDDIFPVGAPGNTEANYMPYYDGEITDGGSVYGECEVSKNSLEADAGVVIRTFRAGHLAYNKYLINVLDDLGYDFNSNYTAGDVLTNFPYLTKMGRSFSGERSHILEIPLAISDVFHADPISSSNIMDKVDIWTEVMLKNNANHANTCLLMHPNRIWKNTGQEAFLDNVPESVAIMEMSNYGDYWNLRTAASFETALEDNILTITLDMDSYNDDERISFVINEGQDLDVIFIIDKQGNSVAMQMDPWEENDIIVYNPAPIVNGIGAVEQSSFQLDLFPNPCTTGLVNIRMGQQLEGPAQLTVYDLQGRRVMGKKMDTSNEMSTIDMSALPKGIYMVKAVGKESAAVGKLVLQ